MLRTLPPATVPGQRKHVEPGSRAQLCLGAAPSRAAPGRRREPPRFPDRACQQLAGLAGEVEHLGLRLAGAPADRAGDRAQPAAGIALVVGVLLTVINQSGVIAAGDATTVTWVRCGLNFVVPFLVSNAGLLSGRR